MSNLDKWNYSKICFLISFVTKKCIKSVSRRHKGSPKPLILLGFRLLWCQVVNRIILNGQTFLSCLFLFFLSFFLSVPEPKGDYHHPPVSCTTIYKLLKTSRLHNAISVRYTEPKNRLKKCEILSIFRKIRLFEDVFYFFLALSLYFLLVFPVFFFMEKKAKKQEPCCYT